MRITTGVQFAFEKALIYKGFSYISWYKQAPQWSQNSHCGAFVIWSQLYHLTKGRWGVQFPPGGVQFQQKGMCKFSKRGVHSGLWLMNCSSSCRAGKDGGIYEMLPQFICELGVLFFYFSLLAKPATANIKPISPMPVVMYEKLPDHESRKRNKQ